MNLEGLSQNRTILGCTKETTINVACEAIGKFHLENEKTIGQGGGFVPKIRQSQDGHFCAVYKASFFKLYFPAQLINKSKMKSKRHCGL